MKRVYIDFAPPSLARALLRGSRPALALLLLSLSLAPSLVNMANRYRTLLREQAAANARRVAVVVRARALAPAPVPEAQANAVNAAVLELNLPWAALHDAVQSATPASIALLALEPDAKTRNLRITAEARNSDDMTGYVEQLRRQDWFSTIDLVRHEINEQAPNRPIRFQIDAGWRGP